MSQFILTDFFSPLTSWGIRLKTASFAAPTRFHGYDTLTASASTPTSGYIAVKVIHQVPLIVYEFNPAGEPYASFVTPQGLVVFETAEVDTEVAENQGSAYVVYLLYARTLLDKTTPENSSTVINISAGVSSTHMPTYEPKDLVIDPTTDTPLGMVVVHPGASGVGEMTYVKQEIQPFGWELGYTSQIAWQTKDNLFKKLNAFSWVTADNTNIVAGELQATHDYMVMQLTTNDTLVDIRRDNDGVMEEFVKGSKMTLHITAHTLTIDGGSTHFDLPNNKNLVLPVGSYTFIKNYINKWMPITTSTEFLNKVSKQPAWISLTLSPTITARVTGIVEYYVDALGSIHFRANLNTIADLTMTTGENLVLPGIPANLAPSRDTLLVLNPVKAISSKIEEVGTFLLKTDGTVVASVGFTLPTTIDFQITETVVTPATI